jgi:hypothetical protein
VVSFIPSGFTTEIPICATHPAYLIVLHVITRIIFVEQHKSLCSFIPRSVTSSLLVPNISLGTLFSNTLCLCYSLNVSDQVSHPHRAAGRIITCLPTASLCVRHGHCSSRYLRRCCTEPTASSSFCTLLQF